jgi:CheY-like chemotaxis protein
MKILLVDDDTFLRDMYATKFIECGHAVVTAVHATDALRIIEQGTDTFNLIIVDMIMPGMTGVELITELRKLHADSPVQFIVLSNQGQDQDIDEAKAAGAIGYIIKAQSVPSEVVRKVEQIIAEQKK